MNLSYLSRFTSFALVLTAALGVAKGQSVIDLGDFSPLALNNSGQIVGYSYDAQTNTTVADEYANGALADIQDLPGNESEATGINDSGEVVGFAMETNNGIYVPGNYDQAFSESAGTVTNLGTLGGDGAGAEGVNSSGEIVGWSETASDVGGNGKTHPFLYENGTMTNLGDFGANFSLGNGYTSLASAINASGQVAGGAETSTTAQHAFLYTNGTKTDLGTLGGLTSKAFALNDSGQVVGVSNLADGYTVAFLYSNGQMTSLGTLGGTESQALGINDAGEIIGTSYTTTGSNDSFLYTAGTGMQDLDKLYSSMLVSQTGTTAGFTDLNGVTAINNSGDIIGTGTYNEGNGNSETEGFEIIAAPEPSTWILTLGGLLVIVIARRRVRVTGDGA